MRKIKLMHNLYANINDVLVKFEDYNGIGLKSIQFISTKQVNKLKKSQLIDIYKRGV